MCVCLFLKGDVFFLVLCVFEGDVFFIVVCAPVAESKLTTFWDLVLDDKKPLFTTEKFLAQANDEGVCVAHILTHSHTHTHTHTHTEAYTHRHAHTLPFNGLGSLRNVLDFERKAIVSLKLT